MAKQEQSETWQDIKEIWGKSSQGETIYFEFSKLIDELKGKISQWEKDSLLKQSKLLSSTHKCNTLIFKKNSMLKI